MEAISPFKASGYIGKCALGVREFFTRVLELAKERGHTIYWGTVGLSIRAQLPSGLTSFVYGMPPDEFQFYFPSRTLRDKEVSSILRNKLLAFGFLGSGTAQ